MLASSDQSGTIWIWDLATGKERHHWRGHIGEAQAVRFTRDGALLLSTGQDGCLRFWRATDWNKVASIKVHEESIYALAVSPDGHWVATGSSDETVNVWNLHAPSSSGNNDDQTDSLACDCAATFALGDVVYGITFNADSEVLAAATGHGVVVLDRNQQREPLRAFDKAPVFRFFSSEFLSGGQWLALSGSYQSDRSAAKSKLWRLEPKLGPPHPVWIYDVREQSVVHGLLTDARQIRMDVSPDKSWMAAAGGNGIVTIWHVGGTDLEHVAESSFNGHSKSVEAVRTSPDGKYLLTGSSDGTVKVWNSLSLPQPRVIRHFPHHDRGWEIAYAFDGKSLLIAAERGSASRVDMGMERPTEKLTTYKKAGLIGLLSSDGARLLLSGYGEGQLISIPLTGSPPRWDFHFGQCKIKCICTVQPMRVG